MPPVHCDTGGISHTPISTNRPTGHTSEIYGAIIVLTGVIVGATQIVVDKITELKKSLKDKE